jgi:hypothetical protein
MEINMSNKNRDKQNSRDELIESIFNRANEDKKKNKKGEK